MKSWLRISLANALSLFLLSQIFQGVKVQGGVESYIIAGAVFAIMFKVVRPIIGIITFPLNFLTMGSFSFLTNIFVFYLATKLANNITISSFTYPGLNMAGFIIPQMHFNMLTAYLGAAFIQSVLVSFILWLRK